MPKRTNVETEKSFESVFRHRQASLWFSEGHKKALWSNCHMYDLDLSVDDDGFVCDDAFEAEHKHNYVRYEWKGAGYGDKLKPGQRWHLTRCTHAMRMSPVVKKIALVLASGNEAAHVRDIRITLQGVDDWTMINVFPDGPCIVDGAEWEAWECRFLERIPSYYMQVDERRRRLNEMGTRGDLPTGIELSDMLAYVHEIGMSRDISNTDLVMINRLRNSGRSRGRVCRGSTFLC